MTEVDFFNKARLSDWLHLFGAVLIATSIFCALMSNYYNSAVMGEAGLGFAVWGAEPGTEEYNKRVRLRNLSDTYFTFGIIFAGCGLLAQVSGLIVAVAERG